MNGKQQDSEPLLDEADYQLIRGDSFLTRMGSNNFASLIEPLAEPSHNILTIQPQQQYNILQASEIHLLNEREMLINDDILGLPSSEFQLDATDTWNIVDNMPEVLDNTKNYVLDSNSSSSSNNTGFLPDTSSAPMVPSLNPWDGEYDFNLSLPFEKDRTRWCFSEEKKKLYVCPNVAVPVQVKVKQWIDATITIMPVFKGSTNRVKPVMPCFNCKSRDMSAAKDHIVVVDGQECEYKVVNDRHVVCVPLLPPPPGETTTTLLVRLTCLTSCIGGPNRRPFSLVFTLHNSAGMVLGRQVLDLKCCKCPSRDMRNEAVKEKGSDGNAATMQDNQPQGGVESTKRKGPQATTSEKRQCFVVKVEPGAKVVYQNVPVPVQFVPRVKDFVNMLVAQQHLQHNNPNLFPFPEN